MKTEIVVLLVAAALLAGAAAAYFLLPPRSVNASVTIGEPTVTQKPTYW